MKVKLNCRRLKKSNFPIASFASSVFLVISIVAKTSMVLSTAVVKMYRYVPICGDVGELLNLSYYKLPR